MPLRDLFVFFVSFGSIPFIIGSPHLGVIVFAWLGYMNPHRFSWGLAYSFPFSAFIGGLTLLFFILSSEPKKIPGDRVIFFWALFVAWGCLTYFVALNPVDAEREIIRFLKIQVMLYLFLAMFQHRKRLILFLGVLVASLGFFSVKGGLFTLFTGGNFMVLGPPESFISGNTEIGFATVVILPLMFFLRTQFEKKWARTAVLVCVFLSCFGILGTHSRGAFLALLFLFAYMVYKSDKKILALILAFFALTITFTAMPDKYFQKMETIQNYEEDASAMGRINAWWAAFYLANDRPLTGGGFNAFSRDMFYRYAPNPDDFHDAHSIYFEVLGELGYPGLLFFLMMLFFSYRNCTLVINQTREDPNMLWAFDLGRMLQASFVAYCVGGAFLGLAYFDLLYHLVAVSVLLKVIVNNDLNGNENSDAKENLLTAET